MTTLKKFFLVLLILNIFLIFGFKKVQAKIAQPIFDSANPPKFIMPGRLLIKTNLDLIGFGNPKDIVTKARITQKNQKIGVSNIKKLMTNKKSESNVYLLNIPPDLDPEKIAQEYRSDPAIIWAQPSHQYLLALTPNDPQFSSQWNLTKLSASAAWDIENGDTSVNVAVIDTGVDYDHEDLAANIATYRYDFVDIEYFYPGFGPTTPADDYYTQDTDPDDWSGGGHGTHVAGIVSAATNNATGIAGIGFSVEIMVLRAGYYAQCILVSGCGYGIEYGEVVGFLDDAGALEAINAAVTQGADVINMSWGTYDDEPLLEAALSDAYSAGLTLVAAAGNDGTSTPLYPSAYNQVIAVAATNSSDARVSWSNYGNHIEISAPGDSVLSTYPGNTYGYGSGTSMATPHVAGVAALIKSQNPTFSPAQIRERIAAGADKVSGMGSSNWTQYYGFGRLNAANALTQRDLLITATSTSKVYAVGLGQRYWIYNPTSLSSWGFSWSNLAWVSSTILNGIWSENSDILSYLANEPATGKVYRVASDSRRWIYNAETFNIYGYNWGDIRNSSEQIQNYFLGSPGTDITFPMLTHRSDGKVFYMTGYGTGGGQKRHIKDPDTFNNWDFNWSDIVMTSPAWVLANYPESQRLTRLINEPDGKVYYLYSGGTKRWIENPATFNAYGFSWADIVNAPEAGSYYWTHFTAGANIIYPTSPP